ncbi:MAG: PhoH family protein [Oligoflexia bacterium]|nr:PhoH family protein [Oligoflexia bacterium]
MKTYVLDTNVLLLDPLSIYKFAENNVFIPLVCIEELDRFKKDQNENGRNARFFSRVVDELRKKGSLADGIKLENGGTLIISNCTDADTLGGAKALSKSLEMINLASDKSDNLILGLAIALKNKGKDVVLVTQDINLRLKADVFRVVAEDYGYRGISQDALYQGHTEYHLTSEQFEIFRKNEFLPIEFASVAEKGPVEKDAAESGAENALVIYPNQYLVLVDIEKEASHNNATNTTNATNVANATLGPHKKTRAYGRYTEVNGQKGIVPLISLKDGVWGIYPKNIEQHFALDALLNDDIKLVTLAGKAGTGKTLIAIAAALEKTITRGEYMRLLVSRPIQPMGKDLGFLPGGIEEKMNPWMLPIFDALDFIFGKYKTREVSGPSAWMALKDKGLLQVEPLTYIRGRSIPSQFFIIDEAQNLSPHELKTIITRVGEGSKIVLSGDYEQVDNPYLDTVNNGLTFVIERMRGQKSTAHVTLKSGERSFLSELASKLL